MEKSYQEILRLLEQLGRPAAGLVYKGSRDYLVADMQPQDSAAARNLVERALVSPLEDPLYVVAIGAITNVASAILLDPAIIEHIVIVWLGGNALYWPTASEFNLKQDVSRRAFDLRLRRAAGAHPLYGRDDASADDTGRTGPLRARLQQHRRLPDRDCG